MDYVDYVKLGQKICDYRNAKYLTQAELAKKIDVSTSYIGHIERGTRIPSVETFFKLCLALDADPGVLLSISVSAITPPLTHRQKK